MTLELFTMPLLARPLEDLSPRLCPVCGKFWRPWSGSLLPCHARCLWTQPAAVALVYDTRPITVLAQDVGVSIATVRAGIRQGKRLLTSEHSPDGRVIGSRDYTVPADVNAAWVELFHVEHDPVRLSVHPVCIEAEPGHRVTGGDLVTINDDGRLERWAT